ncbi:hypothetical protein QQ045_014844 [Rhodiola kirilowii]
MVIIIASTVLIITYSRLISKHVTKSILKLTYKSSPYHLTEFQVQVTCFQSNKLLKELQVLIEGTTICIGGTGGPGLSRSSGRLARFRSAPVTWLEALLEDDDDEGEGVDDSLEALKPTESLTQLLSSSSLHPINSSGGGSPLRTSAGFDVAGGHLGMFESSTAAAFLRQNSSPMDLFTGGYDGFFANYGHDYLSTPPPAKT